MTRAHPVDRQTLDGIRWKAVTAGVAVGAIPMSDCAGCGAQLTGRQRRWCGTDCQRDAARAARLASIFNLTPDEYDLILMEQGGACAVCDKPMTDKAFPIDHDHKTSYVRGILCTFCNLRVVAKHTDPRLLQRAAQYLTDPPARRALGRDVVAPGRPKKKRKPRRRRAA